MRKKITTCFIFVILVGSFYLLFCHATEVMEAVTFAFSLWQTNLLPSLFPFFVLSDILIQYGFVSFLGELLRKPMNSFFYLSGECGFVLAMSMVSGFPSGAKYTRSLVDSGIIDTKEGARLLTFTHFSNPFFIVGTIGSFFLGQKKLGVLILVCHFVSNFIIGLLFRPLKKSFDTSSFSLRLAFSKMHRARLENKKTFGQIVTLAITNTLRTLLFMFGVVTFFLIITTVIKEVFPLEALPQAMLSGILEMTQGIKYTASLPLSLMWKAALMTAMISFGGFSVHMQVMSLLEDTDIPYRYFFFARVLHALLAVGLLLFFFPFMG